MVRSGRGMRPKLLPQPLNRRLADMVEIFKLIHLLVAILVFVEVITIHNQFELSCGYQALLTRDGRHSPRNPFEQNVRKH
jgi:hypothetical protein